MATSDTDRLGNSPSLLSNNALAKASLLPDSPNSASHAPSGKFKMLQARLTEEFDEVSAMLEKEINHRVHLEAKIAYLSAQIEKQTEMAALGDTTWQANKSTETPDKTDDVTMKECKSVESTPEGNQIEMQKSATKLSGQSLKSDAKSVKTRKEEQLEQFELIRGWKGGNLYTSESKKSIAMQVGIVRANARRMVESQAFDAICSIFIIYNAALLGAAADYAAINNTDPQKPPMFYKVSDRICTVWFVVELSVRLSAEGIHNFFFGSLWTWNLFDFIVVVSDLLMTILDAVAAQTQVDFSFLRMLRVLRVTRAIRVVRLVRFFKELRMMVFSVLRSGTSLLWSLILFGLIHYIFGIFLLQQVNDYLWDEYRGDFDLLTNDDQKAQIGRFQSYWGGLASALYTMYACMSGGVSWKDVSDDVRQISWVNGVVLGFFIFFCTVVVMNIITGIFVDTAIQSAQNDRDEIIQEQIHSQESELARLKQAFLEADNDGSATITLEEFQTHLQDRRVCAHLASIGLEIHEAMGLFKLLDIDGSGHVGIEEFVVGCMRLKGGAKSIDLATLMYENKRMVEQHSHFHEFCEKKFDEVLYATALLKKDINQPIFAPQSEKHYLV